MLGGQNKQPRATASPAYTIVEVMIFVAVSGMMFVTAALFINGKQAQVEFRQGMNNVNTAIQDVVNQVADGEYPSNNNFQCKVDPASSADTLPTFSNGIGASISQGANSGCTFLGKVLQFNPSDLGPTGYYVYTLAGRQFNDQGDPANSFAEAQPQVVYKSPDIDLTQQSVLQDGLGSTGTYSCADESHCDPIGAFGFFGSFNGGAVSNNQGSGSQTVTTAVIPGVDPDHDKGYAITQMNLKFNGNLNVIADGTANISNDPDKTLYPVPPSVISGGKYLLLCFDNGKGRAGAITIGGTSGQQFTTTLYFDISTSGVAGKCLT